MVDDGIRMEMEKDGQETDKDDGEGWRRLDKD